MRQLPGISTPKTVSTHLEGPKLLLGDLEPPWPLRTSPPSFLSWPGRDRVDLLSGLNIRGRGSSITRLMGDTKWMYRIS